jgi:hypothetical protein
MLNGKKLSGLGAELLVVVLGVAIALAADGWRETAVERRVEAEYIGRLTADLSATVGQLTETRERFMRVEAAGRELADALDGDLPTADDGFVQLVLEATRAGMPRTVLGLDGTFRELEASGRLAILKDASLRQQLVEFYLAVDNTRGSLTDESTVVVTDRITHAIGLFPGRAEAASLSAADRRRLMLEARSPQFLRDLRHLVAKLDINDDRLSHLIVSAETLLGTLQAVGEAT